MNLCDYVVTAAEDKREWMKRKLSFLKNITEWEQMGGTGILFEGAEEPLKKLAKLEEI